MLWWVSYLCSDEPINRSHCRSALRSMDVVTNAIMLHNVMDMTDIIENLVVEGYPVT